MVGIGKAKELIFTAKVLTGQEASQIGIVEHVVAQNGTSDAAYEKALEIAKLIIGNVRPKFVKFESCDFIFFFFFFVIKGPVAVRMAKYAIDYGMQVSYILQLPSRTDMICLQRLHTQ